MRAWHYLYTAGLWGDAYDRGKPVQSCEVEVYLQESFPDAPNAACSSVPQVYFPPN